MAGMSRRRFLRRGVELGAGAFMLGGCSGPVRRDANPAYLELPVSAQRGSVSLGRYEPGAWREACERTVAEITDLSWLGKGDSVFLKVASNSPYPHPSVTSPESVKAVVELLRDRGAGTIYVGDQAGVEHVRLTTDGRVSSTREAFQENGLLAGIEGCGATVHCFDDQGWDGYFQPELDFASSWEGKLWLPKILQEVDHVIYLPRLANHALCGYTCAVKIAVGWMRDDTRLHLHQKAATLFQKIAECNHVPAIREKLRFSLTLGDEALLNIGPDIGSKYDLGGVVALGATNLVDHDLMASALLIHFDRDDTSVYDAYAPYPEDADHWNQYLVDMAWGEEPTERYTPLRPYELEKGLAYDHLLSHLATLQGYRPDRIDVRLQGQFQDELLAYLRGYGEGSAFELGVA